MHTEDGQRPRTATSEVGQGSILTGQKYSKYTPTDSLALRASLGAKNKFTTTQNDQLIGKENNPASSNPSSKLFYLKKNKLESNLAMSYNSAQFGTYLSSQKENVDDNAVLGSSLKNYLNSRKDKMVTSHRRSQWADPKKVSAGDSSRDSQLLKDRSINSTSKHTSEEVSENTTHLNNYLQPASKLGVTSANNRFSAQRSQTSPNEGVSTEGQLILTRPRGVLAEILPSNTQSLSVVSTTGKSQVISSTSHNEITPSSIRDIHAVRESLGILSDGGKTIMSLESRFGKSQTGNHINSSSAYHSTGARLGTTSEANPANLVLNNHYQLLANHYQGLNAGNKEVKSTATNASVTKPLTSFAHVSGSLSGPKASATTGSTADDLPSPTLALSPQPASKDKPSNIQSPSVFEHHESGSGQSLPPAPLKGGNTPKKLGSSAAGGVLGRKTKVEVRESLDKDLPGSKNNVQLDPTRRSTQESGVIKSYAVNTNEGLVRNYNEDRVSIILNIMQSGKSNDPTWPKSAFFGLYDGHCGSACAEFLRDNLHKYILRDKNFPQNPREAIREGIMRAETEFFKKSIDSKGDLIEKSGSCALILLVVDEVCYVANVGDSRAVLSRNGGKEAVSVSNDHKPCASSEKERIMKAGGKIYRTQIQTLSLENDDKTGEEFEKEEIVNGPYRVFPGRLSVSRTFGDFEAKMTKYGGNPNVVVVDPDIFEVKVDSQADFMLLGCDGVFDRFTTEELVSRVWETSANKQLKGTFHDVAAEIVENIFEDTFQRKAWDNITVILVCFKNLFASLAKMKQKLYKSEKDPKMLGLHG